MNLEPILKRLEGVRRVGNGWIASCPAHADRSPSLSLRQGREGRVLLYCHAGCTVEAVCAALSIRMSDCRRKAEEIRTRAAMEARPWVVDQMMTQANGYERVAFQWMLKSIMSGAFKQVQRAVKAGPLNKWQVKLLRLSASAGDGRAQRILEKLSSTEKSKNNLPVPRSLIAKSFRSHGEVAGNSAKTVLLATVENQAESAN